jgi:chloramphenicol O-acetyltransferase
VCRGGVGTMQAEGYDGFMTKEGRYRVIQQEGWPRREQFELFKGFGFPYFSLTADIDITTYRTSLPQGHRFTIGIVHALAAAANAVPEFRQRIRGQEIIEFDVVHPSIILLNDDEAFRFCAFPFKETYGEFARDAADRMERARAASSLFDFEDQDDFLFMTCIPWVSFNGVMHAAPTHRMDSVPRIAWGKARTVGDRVHLPLNVQVHHALIDGLHASRFFNKAEEILGHADAWLISS